MEYRQPILHFDIMNLFFISHASINFSTTSPTPSSLFDAVI